MIVKNPKLIPKTLIDLASYYGLKSLEAYYERPKTKSMTFLGHAYIPKRQVILFLKTILCNSRRTHYGYWRALLEIFLHEVGHIKEPWCYTKNRYQEDEGFRSEIEARAWCYTEKEIARLLGLDGGLFEPEYLGAWDILRSYQDYDEIWARYVGSQYPLEDVVHEIFDLEFCLTPNDRYSSYFNEAMTLVKRLSIRNKIGRIYEDKAGTKHFFFSYGEVERLKGAKIICAIRNLGIPEEWYRSIGYVSPRYKQLVIKEIKYGEVPGNI